jgi:hypothetical protein
MRVREVEDEAERARLWKLAIAAFPPYAEYQSAPPDGLRSLLQSRRDVSVTGLNLLNHCGKFGFGIFSTRAKRCGCAFTAARAGR